MTTGLPALRALVIYGLCLPLALMIGYLLANPLTYGTIAFFGVVLLLLCFPLLLKFHHLCLIAALNMTVVAFLVPGRPNLWMVLTILSLTVSIVQLALSRRMSFLHAPTVARPLLFLLVVVLLTMKLTGGIGFHIFGGENIGGKRYINLLAGILAFFALTARRIPLQKASLYTGLFFLGGATAMVSSLVHFVPPGFTFIFWMFPPEAIPGQSPVINEGEITRLGGVAFGSLAIISFLLARYGIRGIFLAGKPGRALFLFALMVLSLFGGYRVVIVTILLYLAIQGLLEGVFNSRLMPVMVLGLILVAAATLPFISKLPLNFQRALSVLPVEVSPEARQAAESTSDWRIQIWKDVLPEVPQYLLLGKGYAMSLEEWSQANASTSLENEGSTIVAGDYHSGPLSTVIPFGIWGLIGFLWLLWAGGRLLYFNFRFGDPALKSVNTFLLAAFLGETIIFIFVFGGFHSDMIKFTALLGMSVALNGGMCKPERAPARQPVNIKIRTRLNPAHGFSR